jgi:glucose-6-phosphate isomerase
MQPSVKPKHACLDLGRGFLSPSALTKRTLKDLDGFFADRQATENMLKSGQDPVIYEVHESLQPQEDGYLNFGTTILYPGKIGKEFYMTKGHFHLKEASSEVYLALRGEGLILLQSRMDNSEWLRMSQGDVIYVPPGWGHRTVNVGAEKLVFLFTYQADARHDYASVEKRGFSKLVMEDHGSVEIVDNPRFKAKI